MKPARLPVNRFGLPVPYLGRSGFAAFPGKRLCQIDTGPILDNPAAGAGQGRQFHLSEQPAQIRCCAPVAGAAWATLID
jgi:hypothetical protein